MTDNISRQALLDALNEKKIPYNADINEVIKEQPSTGRHGKWINCGSGIPTETYYILKCDMCGASMIHPMIEDIWLPNFCPNCSADMKGEMK